ncbi:hypothetical protein ACIBL8_24055 [Streptomyces sp. NPDC050523]|uniref:hypothetical protein n=1 Tax=Streptomyces sp. NPDC050523 TaxID=3365622 RepID=UPI00379D7A9F
MRISPSVRPAPSPNLWLTRGRHEGSDAPDVVRATLRRLEDRTVLDDQHELPGPDGDDGPERIFEARWKAAGTVTVRARLTLARPLEGGQDWVLAAEAERPWNEEWPSPATMFWPDEPGVPWDHEPATGLRLRGAAHLPTEDKEIRRLLRGCVRGGWSINVVVHEAMTPDEAGRRPLGPLLPPSLRHRVLEHRAAPEQLRIVNRALREFGVQVPRGGAVVLPTDPAPPGYDADEFSVRTVFLDGKRPTELVDALSRFAALPPPLPDGGDEAVRELRDDWDLMTLEEQLDHERRLVAMYSEALEAMTKSRDLYREAAERAHEALTVLRENGADVPVQPQPRSEPPAPSAGSPFQQLTRTFERFKDKALRPAAGADGKPGKDGRPEPGDG